MKNKLKITNNINIYGAIRHDFWYNFSMENMYERTEKIIGKNGVERLQKAHIFVIGLGGVGSYAAEACARSGVGQLTLVDFDKVSPSNLNRQLYALNSTLNVPKTEIATQRIKDINPDCILKTHSFFISPENINEIHMENADYVIDAVDNITAKLEIAKFCEKNNIRHISVMGTANKTDPTKLTVTDIYKTQNCPLAKALRKLCRENEIKKLKVVYSEQLPVVRTVPVSSMIFVPASAGLLAAREAVFDIINM